MDPLLDASLTCLACAQCGGATIWCERVHCCWFPSCATHTEPSGPLSAMLLSNGAQNSPFTDGSTDMDALKQWMEQNRFGTFCGAVHGTLGVKTVGDLKYVKEDDLHPIGFKPVQVRRFTELVGSMAVGCDALLMPLPPSHHEDRRAPEQAM